MNQSGIKTALFMIVFIVPALAFADTKAIVLQDFSNHEFKLEQKPNETIIIQAWASWCATCGGTIKKIYDELNLKNASNIQMITVSIDDNKDSAHAYMAKHREIFKQPRLKVARDPGAKVLSKLGLEAIPATIIIKPNGQIKVFHGHPSKDRMKNAVYESKPSH